MSVRSLRRALLAAAVTLVCGFAPSTTHASPRVDRLEAGIVKAMNHSRASHGLPKLRTDSALARAADFHSATMVRANVLDHGPFKQRMRRYVRARAAGETLAWQSDCNAHAIVQMWLKSPGHRAVLLSRVYRRVGVARRGASAACFVTADFASAR